VPFGAPGPRTSPPCWRVPEQRRAGWAR
jgi:hypothetical protein